MNNKQLIIIGTSGKLTAEHMKKIIAAVSDDGLQIRHASARHNGATSLHIGTLQDLEAETEVDSLVEEGSVTLEMVNDNVLRLLELAVPPAPRRSRKKEGGADAPQVVIEPSSVIEDRASSGTDATTTPAPAKTGDVADKAPEVPTES